MTTNPQNINSQTIKAWAKALGFQQLGITDTKLDTYAKQLQHWLEKNYHGEMSYMARNLDKRCHPEKLLPGTKSIIVVGIDYLPPKPQFSFLKNPIKAFISRYAVGRDYHKLIRKRLQKLADKISEQVGGFEYRAFADSAPVFEKALAQKSGLGWMGKHTNILNKTRGSWFFLGVLYTNLDLEKDMPIENHCGTCTACIDICPTNAIIAPYQLDAQRCISYLTIELRESIPLELRPLIGNRIYGCDDCQMACPWNKFASSTEEESFYARRGLDTAELIDVFQWSETDFLAKTEGSAIRRLGYDCWVRNIAVALGNAEKSQQIIDALSAQLDFPNDMVREHVEWAIAQQQQNKTPTNKLDQIPQKRWLYLD
jgi:epoxyqueuosine reductase